MKIRPFHLALGLVGLVLGILLSVQFRVTRDTMEFPQVHRVTTISDRIHDAQAARDAKQDQLNKMREELDQVATGASLGTLKEQLASARIESGGTGVYGPGIEVTLNDSNLQVEKGGNPNWYVLHDEDILRVLNELRAAGAEAMAINSQRILATTEVRCTGPTILVNRNQRIAPPFVIQAIGNQDTLINSLKMRNGVIDSLQPWGIQISIKKVSRVEIPPYSGSISFDYAKPAPEGTKQ